MMTETSELRFTITDDTFTPVTLELNGGKNTLYISQGYGKTIFLETSELANLGLAISRLETLAREGNHG